MTEEFKSVLPEPFVDERDYRDDLRMAIEAWCRLDPKNSRYRLCKNLNIEDSTLTNVLQKRRGMSIDLFEKVLSHIGYRMMIAPVENPSRE